MKRGAFVAGVAAAAAAPAIPLPRLVPVAVTASLTIVPGPGIRLLSQAELDQLRITNYIAAQLEIVLGCYVGQPQAAETAASLAPDVAAALGRMRARRFS